MAMYAITPSGEVLQYLDATYVERAAANFRLLTEKDGVWVADVPREWALGPRRPNVLGDSTDVRALKRALCNFDARKGAWRG